MDLQSLLRSMIWFSIVVMFGSALYIRHLAKKKGEWHSFMYSFTGNFKFYSQNWQEVKLPLALTLLAILILILATLWLNP